MLITLPPAGTPERSRRLAVLEQRRHALEALYERRVKLNQLIRSLEDYQRVRRKIQRAECIELTAGRKCS